MEKLCTECRKILEAPHAIHLHAALSKTEASRDVLAGRTIDVARFRCRSCDATWTQETDLVSLSQHWILEARN